jgi:hypothetical protein
VTWIRVQQSSDGKTWALLYAGPLAASSESFLELVKRPSPPFTVLDVWVDDGYGWARQSRQRNYTPHYPIPDFDT